MPSDQGGYDLVIADEAWDIDHTGKEESMSSRKASRAGFTDFVGFCDARGGEHWQAYGADTNAEMIGHIERNPACAIARYL